MGNKNIREKRRSRQKKQKTTRTLMWAAAVLVVVIFIGVVAWNILRPAAGVAVPIMANAEDHVPAGSDPGPFNSDPPTSGQHYGQELDAGFYEESDPEVQSEFAEGYLLHNLEHGYTIFWYNCDLLDEANCSSLKSEIKGVMGELNNFKVIGFPRSSIESPLVMTSWGRMLPLDTFNAEQAHDFIRRNRNRAPEPNAP